VVTGTRFVVFIACVTAKSKFSASSMQHGRGLTISKFLQECLPQKNADRTDFWLICANLRPVLFRHMPV